MLERLRVRGAKSCVFALLVASVGWAENPQTPADNEVEVRPIAVLQTTVTATLGVGAKVQDMLAEKLEKTKLFKVHTETFILPGYGLDEIEKAYKQADSELISFAYVDQERVALFLFDQNRPGKYVATSDPLTGNPNNRITDEWIELRLSAAFTELMRQYALANFEDIAVQEIESKKIPEVSREERSRRLFNELSDLHDGSYYVGANLGMARFAAQDASASVVNVGAYGGLKLARRWRAELGADVFSYLMLHGDLRFQIPFIERYVSISFGGGVNHLTLEMTQNRGFNPTYMRVGQLLYGPSISFDVPLLGAGVRGDIRMLFGDATILLATYGLTFNL